MNLCSIEDRVQAWSDDIVAWNVEGAFDRPNDIARLECCHFDWVKCHSYLVKAWMQVQFSEEVWSVELVHCRYQKHVVDYDAIKHPVVNVEAPSVVPFHG